MAIFCDLTPMTTHINQSIDKVLKKIFSIGLTVAESLENGKNPKKLPWLGFEPQTWKRGTGTATACWIPAHTRPSVKLRCRGTQGKRPMIAYCFTQCYNGYSYANMKLWFFNWKNEKFVLRSLNLKNGSFLKSKRLQTFFMQKWKESSFSSFFSSQFARKKILEFFSPSQWPINRSSLPAFFWFNFTAVVFPPPVSGGKIYAFKTCLYQKQRHLLHWDG